MNIWKSILDLALNAILKHEVIRNFQMCRKDLILFSKLTKFFYNSILSCLELLNLSLNLIIGDRTGCPPSNQSE